MSLQTPHQGTTLRSCEDLAGRRGASPGTTGCWFSLSLVPCPRRCEDCCGCAPLEKSPYRARRPRRLSLGTGAWRSGTTGMTRSGPSIRRRRGRDAGREGGFETTPDGAQPHWVDGTRPARSVSQHPGTEGLVANRWGRSSEAQPVGQTDTGQRRRPPSPSAQRHCPSTPASGCANRGRAAWTAKPRPVRHPPQFPSPSAVPAPPQPSLDGAGAALCVALRPARLPWRRAFVWPRRGRSARELPAPPPPGEKEGGEDGGGQEGGTRLRDRG